MPNPIRSLYRKPGSPAAQPGIRSAARFPGFLNLAPARFPAIHRQPVWVALAKIPKLTGGAGTHFPSRSSSPRTGSRKHAVSGGDSTAFCTHFAVNCSPIEYSPHKEIAMDRTTKPASFQYSQSFQQTGEPASPGAALSQAAALSGSDFPFPAASAVTDLAVPTRRCAERGCVFPAAGCDSQYCVHHRRQEMEPALFHSRQPTWLIIHRSTGPDGSASLRGRSHDRFRLAAQSKAFHQGIL